MLALRAHSPPSVLIQGLAWCQHTVSVFRHVARDVRMACRGHGPLQHQLHPLWRPQVLVCYATSSCERARADDEGWVSFTVRGLRWRLVMPPSRIIPWCWQEVLAVPAAQVLPRLAHSARENVLPSELPRAESGRVRDHLPARIPRRIQPRVQLCRERELRAGELDRHRQEGPGLRLR